VADLVKSGEPDGEEIRARSASELHRINCGIGERCQILVGKRARLPGVGECATDFRAGALHRVWKFVRHQRDAAAVL
jgi:hypothetical protein